MRVKLSFLKAIGPMNSGVIALHHQRMLCSYLESLIASLSLKSDCYCFSSLKGTSKVTNGLIRFLSNKVSLVISSPDDDFLNELLKKIFERGSVSLDKFVIIPRSYQIISEPDFQTVMKYVCISPMIPCFKIADGEVPVDPTTHEFSDNVFECLIHRMEEDGYEDGQLNQYSEFEIMPDLDYFRKIEHNPKKYARIYRNRNDEPLYGYLFPFEVHAHSEMHKFIWQRGIGANTKDGYGMIDMVPESPPLTDHIIP